MAQNAWRARIALPALIAALSVGSVLAAQQVLSPAPGDTFTVTCGPVPLVNATVTASTITGACATPIPTAGQPCPQALHDGITTTGPDGKTYLTWHPPVDPQSGCLFGHEHGADPRSSHANASMPAFGYAAAVMGMVEPHEGFKVFVLNTGETVESNVPNKVADEDDRVVFHMGTSGVGRYTQQFHSMQLDYVDHSGTGNYAHLYGLANTGTTAQDGSVCGPRYNAKDFSTVGCAGTYEIWTAQLRLEHPADPYQGANLSRFASGLAFAVFDPISTRDPADNARLLYTEALIDFKTHYKQPYWGYRPNPDPTAPAAFYQGCRREHYGGPTYFHNAGQSTVYWTDPYGHINPAGEDAMHPIRQQLSATTGHKETNFKTRRDYCGNGIRTPN